MRFLCALMLLLVLGSAAPGAVSAQSSDQRARSYQAAREQYRERMNENVLFLMGGQLGGSYITLAHDISFVVNDKLNLRVLPVVGEAAVQNVRDVVFLRGIDLALTTVQTLNMLQESGELGSDLNRQISYIAPLFPDEMQILARQDINSLEDLKGKKVSFNNAGSQTALLSPILFKTFGIDVQSVNMPQADAIQKMREGELHATVCICPKPIAALPGIKPDSGFKLLDVPFIPALQDKYLPATITSEDYPNLVPKDRKVETIATTTVLISFNWPRGSVRYNRTAKFVDVFFSKFDELLKPPRHALWRTVNIAASLPGWQRFPAAQEWLDKSRAPQTQTATSLESDFDKFVKDRGAKPSAVASGAENERLFQEFLDWMGKRRN